MLRCTVSVWTYKAGCSESAHKTALWRSFDRLKVSLSCRGRKRPSSILWVLWILSVIKMEHQDTPDLSSAALSNCLQPVSWVKKAGVGPVAGSCNSGVHLTALSRSPLQSVFYKMNSFLHKSTDSVIGKTIHRTGLRFTLWTLKISGGI